MTRLFCLFFGYAFALIALLVLVLENHAEPRPGFVDAETFYRVMTAFALGAVWMVAAQAARLQKAQRGVPK